MKKTAGAVLLLLLIGTGVWWNSLDNGFVYDDLVTVEENLFIRDWRNLGKFFSADYYVLSEEYSYRPLVTLTYFADWALFRDDPRGYHLTSLLLHLLTVLAVSALAGKICSSRGAGFLAGLVFLIHPAQTEAVCGISFREDILCCLFFCLSLLLFIKSERRKKISGGTQGGIVGIANAEFRPGFYLLSLLFFVLALLAKEMAVSLPAVIAAYLLIVRRRGWRELLRPAVVTFFAVAVLYGTARMLFLYQPESLPVAPEFGDPAGRLVLAAKSLGLYGRLAFFPVRLTVEYPDPLSPVIWSNFLLIPAMLTAAFLLAAGFKGKSRAGSFGLAFFFLTLLPVINLLPSARLGAERFIYLPLVGFAVWGAETLRFLELKTGRTAVRAAAVLILIALAAGTVSRNRDWKNNYTLFRRAVEVSPNSSKARHGLGNEYFRLGRTREAIGEFKKAIEIFDREPLYYNSLGVAYGEEGRFAEALLQFQRSAALNPGDPLVRLNLSTLFLRTGDTERALEEIDQYIAARPFNPDGFLNRGEILIAGGNYPAAAAAFEQALALHPESLPALTGLGYCHYRLGNLRRARYYWEQALELDPGLPGLRRNLELLGEN